MAGCAGGGGSVSYLSVSNFWKYQNADVWKKAKIHPPWFKHYVHRDRELDSLPLHARLLWYEILASATRNSNVLEADLSWLYAETRVPVEVIAETLPLLVKGGWLSETETPRRSRKPSRETLDNPRDLEVEVDVEVERPPKPPARSGENELQQKRIERAIANGVLGDLVDLDAELAANPSLSEHQRSFLRALIPPPKEVA